MNDTQRRPDYVCPSMPPRDSVSDAPARFALLSRAAAALAASLKPHQVLDEIYADVARLTSLELYAQLELRDDGLTDVVTCRGLPAEVLAALEASRPAPAMPGELVVVHAIDEAEDPRSEALARLDIRSYVWLPLIDRGASLGALLFATRHDAGDLGQEAVSLIRTVGDLVATALARARTQPRLLETETSYRRLFESIDEGVCIFQMLFDDRGEPVDYRWLEVNPMFESQTGLVNPIGRTARELVPDLDASWFRIYGRVALTGEPHRFENHAPAMHRWFDVYAMRVGRPEERKVALVFKDISDRKRRELTSAFLSELHVEFSMLVDPEEILRTVGRRLRRHLHASRVVLAELDEEADRATIILDLHGPGGESALGSHRLSRYVSPDLGAKLRRGQTVAIDDVTTSPLTAARLEELKALGIGAKILAPHVQRGRLMFLLAVYQDEPRRWRDDEVDLLRELSASVWFRLERARADEAVRESDRRKDQFLAVLSHELRNPLASIQSGLHLLERAQPFSERAARARAIMKRQVVQLTRLVDDLLDVTRVSRGRVELALETLDVAELVRGAAEDHRPLFEDQDIQFAVQTPDHPVWVRGDPKRITQALGNLLHNASKFTPAGASASVFLATEPAAKQAVMRVVDSGIGMSPATLASIFEPFAQGEISLARSAGGLGLGLTLVKGIAELHGGEVAAHSAGHGQGAEFSVRLPLVKGGDARGRRPEQAGRRSPSHRILIVEDAEDVAESLAATLELEGHEVDLARSGPEGLIKAKRFRPSIMLCDIGLPGMSGYEVSRALREDPELASICRIALSGYAMPEDVRRSHDAGFDHHFAKPLDLDALRELIATGAGGDQSRLPSRNRKQTPPHRGFD
jgi:signal transduction histidine kinase/ActR/RegA family two-component response regulator/PAS domain-containing protein